MLERAGSKTLGLLMLSLTSCGGKVALESAKPKPSQPHAGASASLNAAPSGASTPRPAPVTALPSHPQAAPWQPPYCAGRATRVISLKGSIENLIAPYPFDPANPGSTSVCGLGQALYTSDGNYSVVWVYFAPSSASDVDYHVVLDGSPLELSWGTLSFDDTGALKAVDAAAPLQLAGPRGLEAPIQISFGTPTSEGGSGRDGLTLSEDGALSGAQDGLPALLGLPCPESPGLSAPQIANTAPSRLEPAVCPAQPTTRIAIRANLASATPLTQTPWDARAPVATSNFATSFWANDTRGMASGFDLYFRKLAEGEWEYHVLLQTAERGRELGSGEAWFSASGALAGVNVIQALHFLEPSGLPGPLIELDFGVSAGHDESSANGLTSFDAGSLLISMRQDGRMFYGAACSGSVAGTLHPSHEFPVYCFDQAYATSQRIAPSCAGRFTTNVSPSGMSLDAGSPVSTEVWDSLAAKGPSDFWASTTVYDATLRAIPLEMRLRHVAASSWEVHVLTTESNQAVERASLRVDFSTDGLVSHVEGEPSFALPLGDGSPGPSVALDFDLATYGSVVVAGAWDASGGVASDGNRSACAASP